MNSRSLSAIQLASDRIDKAIDVWVYAAKNNDKTTRDAAHQEFLASVSSAASASMSSKDTQRNLISNESKQTLQENASKNHSKKRILNDSELETEERAIAVGAEGDIELTQDELEALEKIKESISKRLKLEEVHLANPLSILMAEKHKELNLEERNVTI